MERGKVFRKEGEKRRTKIGNRKAAEGNYLVNNCHNLRTSELQYALNISDRKNGKNKEKAQRKKDDDTDS